MFEKITSCLFAVAVCAVANPAAAYSVAGCTGLFEGSIAAVAEPLEDNTRRYANGNVRLTIMDTEEPANGSFHVAVALPSSEGYRICQLVSHEAGFRGFAGLHFSAMGARYDAAVGLVVAFDTDVLEDGEIVPGPPLYVTIRQSDVNIDASDTSVLFEE